MQETQNADVTTVLDSLSGRIAALEVENATLKGVLVMKDRRILELQPAEKEDGTSETQ